MNLQQIDEYTYKRYLNMTHGLELTPDINLGYRGNENGIVYLASYLMMKHILHIQGYPNNSFGYSDIAKFLEIEHNCTAIENHRYVQGLYNRGLGESQFPKETIRQISHDNISAFSSISQLFSNHFDLAKFPAMNIYIYGLRNFFVFNNARKKFDLPMNPGNYSVWTYNGSSKLFWLLMLPFMLVNMLISLNKPVDDTSSKILYFIKLYPNRDKFIWKSLWKYYKMKMEKQYGKKWLAGLMNIYFLPEHPCNLVANLIEEI